MKGVRYQVLATTVQGGYVVNMGVKTERTAMDQAKKTLKRRDVTSTEVVKLTNGVKVKRELVREFVKE